METSMRPSVLLMFLLSGSVAGWVASAQAQTPAPTPPPECTDLWPVTTIHTIGKGQGPTDNPKVSHSITANVVDPNSLSYTADRIPVCAGTSVSIEVTDATGVPLNTASSGGISCKASGCEVTSTHAKEQYQSRSGDGSDTDTIVLLPE